jgi:putative redox protein
MVEMNVVYSGNLHCTATHGPSGSAIATDAPKDNQGQGAAFSPTDLVGAALGSCVLTIMGIYARRHNLDLAGTAAHVTKEMTASGVRRVAKVTVAVKLPRNVPPEHRAALENAARACPVAQSLHPDVQQAVEFVYGN